MASLARRTAIGATWMVAWRMVTRVLGLFSTLLLARLLVPADFGLLSMATTFAAAIEAMSQLGLQDALVRQTQDDRRLFDTAFTLQAGRAAATAGVIALGAPLAARWFGEPRLLAVLLILAGTTLLAGLENIGIVEFRRNMRFDMQFRLLSIPRLLQVAVTVPLAFAWQSYWVLLVGIVIGKLARTVMTYLVHPYRPRLRLAGWRELAGFSFWIWATCAASIVWDRCDPFVLGPSLGPGLLGVYLLALEMASLPATELIAPAADVLFTSFSVAQKQGTNSVRLAPQVALALLMAILPLIITISCAAGYVVAALLGPKWAAAQPLIAILAWQSTFSPFSYIVSATLVANGLVRRNFLANLAASAIKLLALVSVVSLTDRLDLVAMVTAACVAAESAVFLFLLRGTGALMLRHLAGGFARAMIAAGSTVAVLHATGLAWHHVVMDALPALVHGAGIGLLATTLYGSALAALWWLSGRPAGPEEQLAGFVRARTAAWRSRLLARG